MPESNIKIVKPIGSDTMKEFKVSKITNLSDIYNSVQVGVLISGGAAVPAKRIMDEKILDAIGNSSILYLFNQPDYKSNLEMIAIAESVGYDFASELDKAIIKNSPTLLRIPFVEGRINTGVEISDDSMRSLVQNPIDWVTANIVQVFAHAISEGFFTNTTWGIKKLTEVIYNDDSALSVDKLRYIKTGSAEALGDDPFSCIAKMTESIDSTKLKKSCFLTTPTLFNKLLANSESSRYIVYDKNQYKMFGYPVNLCDMVDKEGADKNICYFGNFKDSVGFAISDKCIHTVEDLQTKFPHDVLYMSMIFSVAIDGRNIIALKCAA